jgi:hypothetical protein
LIEKRKSIEDIKKIEYFNKQRKDIDKEKKLHEERERSLKRALEKADQHKIKIKEALTVTE